MTLAGLVTATGTALGGARALFGPTPTTAGFADLPAPPAAPPPSWTGASRDDYTATTTRQHQALNAIAGADRDVRQRVDDGTSTAARGRSGMTTVIGDTARGVAALAPATSSPAGQVALARHLQAQLNRTKALLIAFERRNITLALAMRRAAAGYPTMISAAPGSTFQTPATLAARSVGAVAPRARTVASYQPNHPATASPLEVPTGTGHDAIVRYIIDAARRRGIPDAEIPGILAIAGAESNFQETGFMGFSSRTADTGYTGGAAYANDYGRALDKFLDNYLAGGLAAGGGAGVKDAAVAALNHGDPGPFLHWLQYGVQGCVPGAGGMNYEFAGNLRRFYDQFTRSV